jgi:hypothetical protein
MATINKARLPRIDFALDLAVKIEGIKLPFRLKAATADHSKLMGQLDEFWQMIQEKIHEASQAD